MTSLYKQKIGGKSVFLIVIAFFTVALTSWEDAINAPGYAAIYEEFASASAFLKGYIVTGPNLFALPFILLTGKLANRFSKKDIILVANIFYTIGGIGGAFSKSLLWFAVCRTIVGVAIGVETTAIMGLLFELFPRSEDSAKVMGAYQGVNTIYGALVAVIAGQLCTINWRVAQLLNGLSIISMLAILFFLPRTPPEKGTQKQEDAYAVDRPEKLMVGQLLLALFETVSFIIFSFLFYYFSSLYLAERQLGTSVFSGWLSSIMLIGASSMNFLLGVVHSRLKRYTGVISVGILAIGFILIGSDIPAWVLIPYAFVNGAVCGIIGSYYPIAVNACVPASMTTQYQSIYSCVIFAAYYFASYVPNLYQGLFHVGYHKMMLVNGIVLTCLAVMYGLLITITNRSRKTVQP